MFPPTVFSGNPHEAHYQESTNLALTCYKFAQGGSYLSAALEVVASLSRS